MSSSCLLCDDVDVDVRFVDLEEVVDGSGVVLVIGRP